MKCPAWQAGEHESTLPNCVAQVNATIHQLRRLNNAWSSNRKACTVNMNTCMLLSSAVEAGELTDPSLDGVGWCSATVSITVQYD
jgi:hypothetical protein